MLTLMFRVFGRAKRSPHVYLFLVPVLVLVLVLQVLVGQVQVVVQVKRLPGIADGCAHVYLDVGSNIGVQVRKLYEPEKYRGAPVLRLFDEYFGSSRRSQVCTFGFEANPVHFRRLEEIQKCYRSKGYRVSFFVPQAVSTSNMETVEFSVTQNATNSDGGSFVLDGQSRPDSSKTVRVETIDLWAWLEDNIFHRRLPSGYGPGKKKPVVVMKMDVEGEEMKILPRLVMHSALCLDKIDFIYYEEHRHRAAVIPSTYKIDGVAMDFSHAIQLQSLDPNCEPTRIMNLDDETYGHDHLDDDTGWRSDDPKIYMDDLCQTSSKISDNFECENSWWCKDLIQR